MTAEHKRLSIAVGKKAGSRLSVSTQISRPQVATAIFVVLACATMTAAWITPAFAAAKGAAIVVDANTGNILYNDHGDAQRHPASLTKMMTMYMAFDMIESGRLSYDTWIKVSKTAAAQPPSKLGLKPGSKIKLINALKSLVTKSANDMAVAIAEHIAGTEHGFARAMTQKARELGMPKTVFRNASGLPDIRQVTTAREMVTLAFRIQDHFPRHYKLFKTRRFHYNGKTYKNHNTLLGRVAGVDGIKTGYIRASGFNLVTSIKKNRRHVIAAVFGGRTAGRRNARMRSLLKRYVSRASTKKTRRSERYVIAAKPRPAAKPARTAARHVPPAPAPRPRSVTPTKLKIEVAKVRRVDLSPPRRSSPRARATVQPGSPETGRPPSTLQEQLAKLFAKRRFEETSATRAPAAPQTTPKTNGAYQIQVGAYRTPAEAERQLASVETSAKKLLQGYTRLTQPVKAGANTLYRARFAGFEAASTAQQTCRELRKREIACIVAR